MPPPYLPNHFNILKSITYTPQGIEGVEPSVWATRFGLTTVPSQSALPINKLDRSRVRAICISPNYPVLFGYVCVMAWGGQGSGPGGRRNVIKSWGHASDIAIKLNLIKNGNLDRPQAYSLFSGNNSIPGLGPSFFSKLLYFFSPTSDFYIMDQWTGKSTNLLCGNEVVIIDSDAPSNSNRGGNYQAFCEEIDQMASILLKPGDQVEELLFSKGGKKPQTWRNHVKSHWKKGSYNKMLMQTNYPHIPSYLF